MWVQYAAMGCQHRSTDHINREIERPYKSMFFIDHLNIQPKKVQVLILILAGSISQVLS